MCEEIKRKSLEKALFVCFFFKTVTKGIDLEAVQYLTKQHVSRKSASTIEVSLVPFFIEMLFFCNKI